MSSLAEPSWEVLLLYDSEVIQLAPDVSMLVLMQEW